MKYWKYQLALLSASASVLLPFSVQAQQTHHVLERLIAQRPAKAADQARAGKNAAATASAPNWGDQIPGAGTFPPSPYVFAALTESIKSDLKIDPQWGAINSAQRELLKQSASLGPEVDALKQLGLLDGTAQAGGADKVNAMFDRHHIPIHLRAVGAQEIAAGGVFDFKADWKGKDSQLTATDENGKDKVYPAFEKPVTSFNADGKTVIKIYRDDKRGITMYMTPANGDAKGYEAYKQAITLTPGPKTPNDVYTEAIIPKMKVRDQGNLPQLIGMTAAGGLRISEAKIYTSADFDQNGAEIKQGLGMVMSKSASMRPRPFIMDKPPLVWVIQDSASKPLIAFRVAQSSWKDPKK